MKLIIEKAVYNFVEAIDDFKVWESQRYPGEVFLVTAPGAKDHVSGSLEGARYHIRLSNLKK